MILAAFTLAGDPDYLAASIVSYYLLVDRIVLRVDAASLSWSGLPMDVEECIRQARLADPGGKVAVRAGAFSHPDLPAFVCETRQRQVALDAASEGADWVLQLDGDEIVPDVATFSDSLQRAVASGASRMDFPARWLYAKMTRGFLETSSRFWGPASGYPGPVAVAAGTKLHLAQQIFGRRYRVEVSFVNTDLFRRDPEPVDQVVYDEAQLLHIGWARPIEMMERKAVLSGHAMDEDWSKLLKQWRFRGRHPLLATATTPLRRKEH